MANANVAKFLAVFLILLFSFYFAGCEALNPPKEEPPPQPNLNHSLYPSQPNYPPQKPTLPPKPIEIHFINVGYGDATLIRSEGKNILFDTGPDADAQKVKDYLKSKGIAKIDLLVLSSPDPLFSSGTEAIINSYAPKTIWTNGAHSDDLEWQRAMALAGNSNLTPVEYGQIYHEGNFSLTVLNPFSGVKSPNADSDSIVLKAEYGKFCALLFSDSEASGASGSDPGTVNGGVDSRIISSPIDTKCQVLKVSHHGSGNAASFQLLDHMQPEMAVISVGLNPPSNQYPEPTTIRRLLLKDISVYTTDRLGTVTVSSYGFGYSADTEYPRDAGYAIFLDSVSNGQQGYYR